MPAGHHPGSGIWRKQLLGLLGYKFSRFQVRIHRTFGSLGRPGRTQRFSFSSFEGTSFSAEPDVFVVGQKVVRMNESPSEEVGLRSSSVAALEVI